MKKYKALDETFRRDYLVEKKNGPVQIAIQNIKKASDMYPLIEVTVDTVAYYDNTKGVRVYITNAPLEAIIY